MEITMNNYTEFTESDNVYIYDGKYYRPIDARLYKNSNLCKKLCINETNNILGNIKTIKLDKIITKKCWFTKINSLDSLLDFIEISDILMIELHEISNIISEFLDIEIINSINNWKSLGILNITDDYKIIKIMFRDINHNPQRSNYDLPSAEKYKLNVKLTNKFNQPDYNKLIKYLYDLDLTDILRKLIKLSVLNPELCLYLIKLDNIKEIIDITNTKDYLIYAFRLMYLMEKEFNVKINLDSEIVIKNPDKYKFYTVDLNNPYICQISKYMNFHGRNLTDPCLLNGIRGVRTKKEFLLKMKIFTKGCLDNLDLSKSAITGSIISACAIINPLEAYFSNFESYLNEYYPSKSKNFNKDAKYSDIDIMVESSLEEFDKIAYNHFICIKKNTNINIEFEKIITPNKHKYKITGLHRDIEIFHVNNIMSTIYKYHLACVRCVYTKNDLYCLPTFIVSAYTGLNMDIRWVSCNADIKDVILKYYQRGFGTILNFTDKNTIKTYKNTSNKWHNSNMTRARRRQQGLFSHSSQIFNPSRFAIGIHYNINENKQTFDPDINKTKKYLTHGKFRYNNKLIFIEF